MNTRKRVIYDDLDEEWDTRNGWFTMTLTRNEISFTGDLDFFDEKKK